MTDSPNFLLRLILILGPGVFALMLLWRVVPRIVEDMAQSKTERRRGLTTERAVEMVFATFVFVSAVISFFFLAPTPIYWGSIDFSGVAGNLVSADRNLFLTLAEPLQGKRIYDFEIVSDHGLKEGAEFHVKAVRPASHADGGWFQYGSDDLDIVGGELLVKGTEGSHATELTFVWSKKCPHTYRVDWDAERILCMPAEDAASPPEGETKTSWWNRLVPSAYAAYPSLAALILPGQTRFTQFKKLVGDVTQFDVEVLASERSTAGSKIAALDNILKLNRGQREELGVLAFKEAKTNMPLDLLDLARHTDPGVAVRARKVAESMDVGHAVEEALAMWHLPPEPILAQIEVLPPAWRKKVMNGAADTLKDVGFTAQETKLRKELAARADAPEHKLVPTGTMAGDRYYLKLTWDPQDEKTASCLASLMLKEHKYWPEAQEKEFASTRSERYVYWYDRTRAIAFSKASQACGVTPEYVAGFADSL